MSLATWTALPAPDGDAGVDHRLHVPAAGVIEEWEALADRTGVAPFLRPGWILTWGKHFSRRPVEVLSVRRGDRLVALLPIVRRGGVLRSPTNSHTPDFGPLVEDRAAAEFLFRGLLQEPHHQIALSFMEAGGEEAAQCLTAARARGYRILVRPLQESPFVELSGMDWPELESRLNAKLRADLRRRLRRLREAGEVGFQVADGRTDLSSLLTEGFQVEPSEWKARSGTAIDSRTDTRSFYREIAGWAAERGMLRLAFLRLDGRPIAFQLGIEDGGVYYFLKGGYDVAFRAFAPGKLLVRNMLARAIESGLRRFEFLGTAESWKVEWTTTCRGRVAVSTFAPGPIGYAGWLANRYGRPVAKRLITSYRRWRAPPPRSAH